MHSISVCRRGRHSIPFKSFPHRTKCECECECECECTPLYQSLLRMWLIYVCPRKSIRELLKFYEQYHKPVCEWGARAHTRPSATVSRVRVNECVGCSCCCCCHCSLLLYGQAIALVIWVNERVGRANNSTTTTTTIDWTIAVLPPPLLMPHNTLAGSNDPKDRAQYILYINNNRPCLILIQ